MSEQLPNLDPALLGDPPPVSGHRPRILLLYGSTRERSFSRLLVLEAARLLRGPASWDAVRLGATLAGRLLADRLMVMKEGQVVESGLTDRVLDDPQAPYTQLLMSSILQV